MTQVIEQPLEQEPVEQPELQEETTTREATEAEAATASRGIKLDDILDETARAEFARQKVREDAFDFQQRRAKMFAASGLFGAKGDSRQAIAQAMVKIELGESLGLTPAESLQGIYLVNGVTSISSAVRASRMQRSGYSWRMLWHENKEGACVGVTLYLYYQGKPLKEFRRVGDALEEVQASVSFLEADAKHIDNFSKPGSAWKKSVRNMYFARAISNAQQFYAPGCLSINIASTEEAMDMEDLIQETETRRAEQPEIQMPRRTMPTVATASPDVMSSAGEILKAAPIDPAKAEAAMQPINGEQRAAIFSAANGDETVIAEVARAAGYETIGDIKQRDYASLLAKVADAAKLKAKSTGRK